MPHLPYTTEILTHILPSIQKHQKQQQETRENPRPFILGLTGLQGCGKSTLATDIVQTLNEKHNIHAIEISLDDFYLTHEQRLHIDKVINADRENALLKVRGQPGTHDLMLAEMTFGQFSTNDEERVAARKYLEVGKNELVLPVFDKSLFAGDGDRLPKEEWRLFDSEPPCEVVVFEGWCLGFRPCSKADIEKRWNAAKEMCGKEMMDEGVDPRFSTSTLAERRLEDLLFVNERLGDYCKRFMGPKHMNGLVHLDSMNLVNVYMWRMEQEHAMHKMKATGMSDDQVVNFVKGYMPAYEIYLDSLRRGFFEKKDPSKASKLHLHVVLDKQRKVVDMKLI